MTKLYLRLQSFKENRIIIQIESKLSVKLFI